jgi:hypothetical protein
VDEIEIRLEAGNTSSVWRRGATIRRSTGSWTPSVHRLLRHLEAAGFQGAPRVLGLDEQGREILSYLEGDVPVYPTPPELWSEEVLRRFCDAYGLADRHGLVDTILGWVRAVCERIVDQAAKGDPSFQRHLAEGHLDGYGCDLEFIRSLREPLQEALEAAR